MTVGQTLVLDNGAFSIKYGIASKNEYRSVPNCIFKSKIDRKRVYVGDQISELVERNSLFFSLPFEKGYLVNWDVEQQVWERIFSNFDDFTDMSLVLSDPIYTVPALEDLSSELIFEEFGFKELNKGSAASWIGQLNMMRGKRCSMIIDCGYSFTHIVPLIDGKVLQRAVIRIDVGGKALTNQLKEWISYRELQVMEETYVINECKEDSCFVSMNFEKDMRCCRSRDPARNPIIREYVLPDFVQNQRGFLRPLTRECDDAQRVTMNVERFTVPEALFRPCEIGLHQMGIGEAVGECVRRLPENFRGAMLENIHVIGGSTLFPNFRERLLADVRSFVDNCFDIKLAHISDPIGAAWSAGAELARSGKLYGGFLTKQQYDESGDDFILEENFFNFFEDCSYENELKESRIQDNKDEK